MSGKHQNIKEIDLLNREEIGAYLASMPFSDLVEGWEDFTKEEKAGIFLALDQKTKLDLYDSLSFQEQIQLLETLSIDNTRFILSQMEPDDIADFIQATSPQIRKQVWESLPDDVKKETLFLLRFDEDDAAGLMTPRYLAISSSITVAQAIRFVRKSAVNVETIYYTYILDNLKRLKGVVSLRDLLSASDDAKISEIMEGDVISVKEDTDQEEVARILETYGFLALPVTDSYNRLLGIITVDDVMEVIRDEQTEDVYKMGAMAGSTEPYLSVPVFKLVWKRIPWLIVLLLVGTITTNVLHHYESLILGAAFLFMFLPVITQTGGNAGGQSSTLMIRGLATGEIRFKDILRIMLKEIFVGLVMGLGTGLVIILRSFLLPPGITLAEAATIGFALSLVVMFSTIIGALAPLLIHRAGLDPTVMSSPLMATLIDVAGLTIYFETARHFLRL